ncbi:MAG: ABC transporter permease [Acidobacteriota bacterium]|nr:ABC transporter permease [Acidobacteriota bacterium]
MRAFFQLLIAEALKLRRTPALLLTLILPYTVVLAFFLFARIEGHRFLTGADADPWSWLAEACLGAWTSLFLPLAVFLLAALVASVEHRSRGLRLLFTLPVPRWQIAAAKHLVVLALVGLSFLLLALGIALAGIALRWASPELGFDQPVPWGALLLTCLWGWLATTFFCTLATAVSLARSSFVLPVTAGFLATILLLILRATDPALALYHPAAYAVEATDSLVSFGRPATTLGLRWALVGLGTGILFALAAGWAWVRGDVD